MDNRLSASCPTPKYNEFLFAPICEEANGMELSVLSALARINVDPWEEATRLAAMPNTIAEGDLVATLDLIPNKGWEPSESAGIAARLIRLLPQQNAVTITTSARDIAALRDKRTSYFLACVAIAISILSSHHQAPTTDTVDSTTKSVATSAGENGIVNTMSPGASNQSH